MGADMLSHVRILDFTRILSGPYATALLADLGADVIKVESPQGDEYRRIGPFREGNSAVHLDEPETLDRARSRWKGSRDRARPADRSDVVVEELHPGVADKSASAPSAEARPGSSTAAFRLRPDGPGPGSRPTSGQARPLMQVTGDPQGPPTMVGEPVADLVAGLYASWAILAALVERQNTGKGRRIDVAMYDCLISFLPTAQCRLLFEGVEPRRVGNRHPLSTPFGAYRASDGHLVIAVLSNEQFAKLCGAIGRPDATLDPRFAGDEARTSHEPLVRALIEDWSAARPVKAAVEALSAAGIPAAAITGIGEALDSVQSKARELLAEIDDPKLGPVRVGQQPVRFAGVPRGSLAPAPALDQHGAEIRREIAKGKP
jgi:CoA:oxalate CoA-transferase